MRPLLTNIFLSICLLSLPVLGQYAAPMSQDAPIPITPKQVIPSKNIRSISLDEIGTLSPNRSGMNIDSWHGSNGPFVLQLLGFLPKDPDANSVFRFNRKLLLAVVEAPHLPDHKEGDFLYTRMKQLALLGNSRAISQLIDKIPQRMRQPKLYRLKAASLFQANKNTEACDLVHSRKTQDNDQFWHLASIICQSIAKNSHAAHLQIKILKESGLDIPPTLKRATKLIASDEASKHNQGIALWQNFIASSLLIHINPPVELPAMQHIYISSLSNNDVKNWWNNIKQQEAPSRLNQGVLFSALLEASGQALPLYVWQDFLLFSLAHNITPPTQLLATLLHKASSANRQAEVLLLSSIAIGNQPIKSVDHMLMTTIVESLKKVGLHNDAKELALEAILDF